MIYWLINFELNKTYVGFSENINNRIQNHIKQKVESTKHFNKFICFRLEEVDTIYEAHDRERCWKSAAGRRKLKQYYKKIKLEAPSSSG